MTRHIQEDNIAGDANRTQVYSVDAEHVTASHLRERPMARPNNFITAPIVLVRDFET